jgi:hypothetical protein
MMLDNVRRGLVYLGSHPMMMLHAARNAARFELSVPMDLLRWAIDRRPRGKGPERIELTAADPALAVGLTVDLYGTKLDISARITVESIENAEGALRVALRVGDLAIQAPPNSPAAMMVGSLDLSRPANLMNMMPQKHAALVSAEGDRFVLDLMKIPALGKNERLKRALAMLSFIQVRSVRASGELLAIGFGVGARSH